MAYEVSKVDVWAADVPNQAGVLARMLEQLSEAGAQLDFMVARKVTEGISRVFLSPVNGAKVQKVASAKGMSKAAGLFSVRIAGPDQPGLGARIASAIASKGINLRGASAASLGKTAIFYFALECEEDRRDAIKAVRKALAK